jgi:4-hydroxymandelate oxidase
LRLVAAERRTFTGPARYLEDPANRADLATYLADLIGSGPTGSTGSAPDYGFGDGAGAGPGVDDDADVGAGGQSYGEMAEALIAAVVPDGQPVDLLVLAYSIHDVQPGRATATYLSSVCPGTPLSFAICDQGSAAAFTGLRIAMDYRGNQADPARTDGGRVLLIVAEQAGLAYPVAPSANNAARPGQHRGVALLFEREPAEREPAEGAKAGPEGSARLVGLRQRPGLAAADVAEQAAAELAKLSAGHLRVRVLANPALGDLWDGRPAGEPRIGPADQPATGPWWQLLDELATPQSARQPAEQPDLLVAADYDPDLGYLCLAAFTPR